MKVNLNENFGYIVSIDRINMAKRNKLETRAENTKEEILNNLRKLAESNTVLSTERLKLIIERIENNFYDQDEILQDIAEKMVKSKEWQEHLKKLRSNKD